MIVKTRYKINKSQIEVSNAKYKCSKLFFDLRGEVTKVTDDMECGYENCTYSERSYVSDISDNPMSAIYPFKH